MAKLLALALTISMTFASIAFAEGPIATSVRAEVDALAASAALAQSGATKKRNPGLMWAGVGVWAAGVTLEILSWTALKHEESACAFTTRSFVCASETSTNWPIMGIGLGLAGGGIAMWILGNQNVPASSSQRSSTWTSGTPRLKFTRSITF